MVSSNLLFPPIYFLDSLFIYIVFFSFFFAYRHPIRHNHGTHTLRDGFVHTSEASGCVERVYMVSSTSWGPHQSSTQVGKPEINAHTHKQNTNTNTNTVQLPIRPICKATTRGSVFGRHMLLFTISLMSIRKQS